MFIMVTQLDAGSIYIRPHTIASIIPEALGEGCEVILLNGYRYKLKESSLQVVRSSDACHKSIDDLGVYITNKY